jgi:hypothetical protein
MKIMEKLGEQRIHKRFQVQEGVFVLIRNDSSILGQIKNISRGGLAFTYIANGEKVNELFDVDIFLRDYGFYLKDVPSKKVADFHVNNKLPFSSFIIRQIGVQFGELKKSQLLQLDNFIQKYTKNEEF